ncbi:MAG: type II toxin-antitoxin system prevent-host-death family antitoxin [Propionibacteriaceae bacterium]|jgi:prevent-host-death family protein|nr:type II toxin-antitoxin system prevent-host-death family antitoxin [Propionibacteriaceae bacterium]
MTMDTPLDSYRITVGQLRQNPTAMIHDVRQGQQYLLTDRGVPVAIISPVRPRKWLAADAVRKLLNQPGDPDWARELSEARDNNDLRDPWEPVS